MTDRTQDSSAPGTVRALSGVAVPVEFSDQAASDDSLLTNDTLAGNGLNDMADGQDNLDDDFDIDKVARHE